MFPYYDVICSRHLTHHMWVPPGWRVGSYVTTQGEIRNWVSCSRTPEHVSMAGSRTCDYSDPKSAALPLHHLGPWINLIKTTFGGNVVTSGSVLRAASSVSFYYRCGQESHHRRYQCQNHRERLSSAGHISENGPLSSPEPNRNNKSLTWWPRPGNTGWLQEDGPICCLDVLEQRWARNSCLNWD